MHTSVDIAWISKLYTWIYININTGYYNSKRKLGWLPFPPQPPEIVTVLIIISHKLLLNIKDL